MNYSSLTSLDICSYKGVNGVEIVEYGEYPQSIIPKEDARKLERLYKKRRWKLNWTAEKYTTDSNLNNNTEVGFITREHHVYEYEGKKYIRLVGDENVEGELLSDGQIVTIGTPYWIKVEPVKWLLDREKDLLISKDALVSGIQFNFKRSYTEKEFDETTIKWYLDNHLSKEIVQNEKKVNINNTVKTEISIQNKDISKKLLGMTISLRQLEMDIDDEYMLKQKEINDEYERKKQEISCIWQELISLTTQTNDVSEAQLAELKKKIKTR